MKKVLITGGAGDWAVSFFNSMNEKYQIYTPDRSELDVTDQVGVKKYFNDNNFDVVINNAGTIHPKRILDSDDDLWIRDVEVNLIGTFLVSKYALKVNHECLVINISSAAGFSSYPDWSSYCSSKAAVNTLTKSIAADGYRAVSLCPGGFDSKFRNNFNLDNSNLMTCGEVTGYVVKAIEGDFESGSVVFFRQDDVKVY